MLIIIAGKMFTTGRIIFTSIFVIAFVAFTIFSYRKDATNNKKHYKNAAVQIAIGIVTVIALLFLSKYLINS